jgi:Holliday junction resolvasome RuvABC DNA-binding subunit
VHPEHSRHPRYPRDPRHPRQRGSASESCALAANGLVNMGFRRAEVRRALDTMSARHGTEALGTIPVETILREALAILT